MYPRRLRSRTIDLMRIANIESSSDESLFPGDDSDGSEYRPPPPCDRKSSSEHSDVSHYASLDPALVTDADQPYATSMEPILDVNYAHPLPATSVEPTLDVDHGHPFFAASMEPTLDVDYGQPHATTSTEPPLKVNYRQPLTATFMEPCLDVDYGSLPATSMVPTSDVDYGQPLPPTSMVPISDVNYGQPLPPTSMVPTSDVNYGQPLATTTTESTLDMDYGQPLATTSMEPTLDVDYGQPLSATSMEPTLDVDHGQPLSATSMEPNLDVDYGQPLSVTSMVPTSDVDYGQPLATTSTEPPLEVTYRQPLPATSMQPTLDMDYGRPLVTTSMEPTLDGDYGQPLSATPREPTLEVNYGQPLPATSMQSSLDVDYGQPLTATSMEPTLDLEYGQPIASTSMEPSRDVDHGQALPSTSVDSTLDVDPGQLSGSSVNENASQLPCKRKISNPALWNINIQKRKRLRGEPYKTKKGKDMPEKQVIQPRCINISKHKCNTLVPEGARLVIFKEFRNLPSLEQQREFLIRHVEKKEKNRKTTTTPSRRTNTLQYNFTVNGERKKVCRDFFLKTLNITDALVRGAFNKLSPQGIVLPELRGKKIPPNKLISEDDLIIREHILSFPAVESHYCRKKSDYKYLDATLNITTMYAEYEKKTQEMNRKKCCLETYRKIFREYKLKFHKPKKDMCKSCIAFNNMSPEQKELHEEEHNKHLSRKTEARACRDADKEAAAAEGNKVLSFNFDLEAVLSTPKGAAGPFFYVRKLAVYNLTVYDLGTQDVICYLWDETEGKRGSIEISTCIYIFIMAKRNIEHVRMMSDSCGGQQKNFHFCSMLEVVKNHSTIQKIDHKFFESGHSQMECDSIHGKIERKSKSVPVYTTEEWAQLIRLARKNPRPMEVCLLKHDDFKEFGNQQFPPVKVLVETGDQQTNTPVGITDAVWIQYRKTDTDAVFFSKTYDGQFVRVPMKKTRTKIRTVFPKTKYNERICISAAKKKDLLQLCKDLQIPRAYHSFYQNLPSSDDIRDALPEPDMDEE